MKRLTMKILIIEDEPIAQASLCRTLEQNFPDMEITGTADSVKSAIEFLKKPQNRPDIIFMDVELSDGNCFEIFREVEITTNVIMTTAYGHYAVKAFEVNSIDYLLKPIEITALKRAVSRCASGRANFDVDSLAKALRQPSQKWRQRYIIRFNNTIVPVETSEIAYFYSEDKNTFIVTRNGNRYILDLPLEVVSEEIDPERFFRISRGCIVALSAISTITKQFGGRLKISPRPEATFDMTVSRSRTDDFLKWLER